MLSLSDRLPFNDRSAAVRLLVLTFLFATVSAAILIAWTYLSRLADGTIHTAGISPLYWEIPNAAMWVLLFPFLYYVVRRNPVHPGISTPSFLAIHCFFALLFAAIHLECNLLISGLLYQSVNMPFADTIPWCPWTSGLRMSWRVLFYCFAVGLCYAVDFFDRTQAKKLNNSELQAQLQATQLNQVKIRIDPVFVQRTLADVASMMQTDSRRAVNTIARLGSFFRLMQQQDQTLSLSDQMKVLRSYFGVESERSNGRIRAQISLDPQLSKESCPEFPLQSLVYAFYRFRLSHLQSRYRLRLRLYKKNGCLILFLKDNLPLPADSRLLTDELYRTIRALDGRVKQYRIRILSHSVCIRYRQNPDAETRFSAVATDPGWKAFGNFPLWISLSAVAPAYFLVRRLLNLLSGGDSLNSPELFQFGAGLLLCAISVPVTLVFARRLPLQKRNSLLIHGVISVVLAAVLIVFEKFLRSPGAFVFSWGDVVLSRGNVIRFPDQILIYWGVLLIGNACRNYNDFNRERIRSSQLQSDLSGAQLKALEMQLHPHFLFNTLHVINGLILTNQSVAANMVARLQDFLNMTFQSSEKHLIPFLQELKFLECYLDIQKIRFGDRLKVRMEVDPETLSLRVPQLILQPIVENAIRHGFSGSLTGGEITLQARRRNGSLQIAVQDNGPGQSVIPPQKKGVGLQNSALRLYHIYGESQQFSFGNRPEGGFQVRMQIPVSS